MKKIRALPPFLFALYPILFLYSLNIDEVRAQQVVIPTVVSLIAAGLLLAACHYWLRDLGRAAIITASASVLFFSYGHAFEGLHGANFSGLALRDYLAPLWLAIFLIIIISTALTKRDMSGLNAVISVIGISLVIMSLANIASHRLLVRDVWQELDLTSRANPAVTTGSGGLRDRPDIYYIILDSYPNAKTLRKIYGFNNDEFLAFLDKRGFYVADQSRSNYPLTFVSLASSLNMEYVGYLTEKVGVETRSSAIPYQMVRNNKAMKFASGLGYKTVHFQSGWSGTAQNRHADVEIETGTSNEFLMALTETSALRLIEDRFGFVQSNERRRRMRIFDELEKIPEISDPTFSFVHLVFPHPPYFFDAAGEIMPGTDFKMGGVAWKDREKYKNQLVFANSMVERMIDVILAKSEPEPIIIIQGDHGPASSIYVEGDGRWENPTDRELDERTGILNAIRVDRGKRKYLSRDVSPVNNLRYVFNLYFDAGFEILPDRVYYSTYSAPFDFQDVTNRLKRLDSKQKRSR